MKVCKLNYVRYSDRLSIKVIKKYKGYLFLRFYGPLGSINYKLSLKKNYILFKPKNTLIFFKKSFWNLDSILFKQIFTGLIRGYKKILVIFGMGYKAKLSGNKLILNLGYSHLVVFKPPKAISMDLKKKKYILLQSNNYQALNQSVYLLRSLRKFNAYKEKGIRLNTETVVFKEGKKRD